MLAFGIKLSLQLVDFRRVQLHEILALAFLHGKQFLASGRELGKVNGLAGLNAKGMVFELRHDGSV